MRLLEIFRRFVGRPRTAPAIVVYTRKECHLCEDVSAVLARLSEQFEFTVEYVDVDQDPELARQFGDRVPVVAVDGRIRAWGKVPEFELTRMLRATAPKRAT